MTQLEIKREAVRKPFSRRRKSCPFSGPNAPKIDYKDTKTLARFTSERGKIVPSRISAVSAKKTARACRCHQAFAFSGIDALCHIISPASKQETTQMQIILLERVEKLGQMGDLVNVKPGYARNYLLPQGKALRANKANMERFEQERAQREADNLEQRKDAETEAAKMDKLAVSMVRAASEMGQLFGSVTSRDIADAVTKAGFTIGRGQVTLDKSIKTLGLHDVRVRLHPEVSVDVIVNIARTLEEAETQLKTGVAVTGENDDEDDLIATAVDTVKKAEANENTESDDDAEATGEEAADSTEDENQP
jgi:large subunit ribosomal protein L9